MPKVNVYLPDDLNDAVKASEVSLSSVCQRALQREVLMRRPIAKGDWTAVADRLWQTKLDEDDQQFAEGYAIGAGWARRTATYMELERMSRIGRDPDFVLELDETHSLVASQMTRAIEADIDLGPRDFTTYDATRPYDRGVVTGAIQVWDHVSELLKHPRDELI